MKKHLLILGLVVLSCSQVFAGDAGPAGPSWGEKWAKFGVVGKIKQDILSAHVSAEVRQAAQFGLSQDDFDYDEIVLVPRPGGGYRYGLNSIQIRFSRKASVTTSEQVATSIDFNQLGKLPGSPKLKVEYVLRKTSRRGSR